MRPGVPERVHPPPLWIRLRREEPAASVPPRAISLETARVGSASAEIPQAADTEGVDDVEHAVHERPDAREHEQRVALLDEELAARPERHRQHQDSGDELEPPRRVDRLEHERPDRPPHADAQEDEPEDVGERGEGALRVDEADDRRRAEQRAEDGPQTAQAVRDGGQHELLDAATANRLYAMSSAVTARAGSGVVRRPRRVCLGAHRHPGGLIETARIDGDS